MSIKGALISAGVPRQIAVVEAPRAERAMRGFDITTQKRAEMFLAQVLHESGGLQFFEEIASGTAYEGRRDLGNVHPGDGRRYKGRGPIQLTGRSNYKWAATLLGLPLEKHPEMASQHTIGWRIAGLYWESHGLNQLADQGKFVEITRRINGGENGLASRRAYLAKLQRVDCRPMDPLHGYTASEIRWIREYDRLVRTGQDTHRQGVLRQAMIVQRKRIFRAAKDKGWTGLRRRRYESLLSRTR